MKSILASLVLFSSFAVMATTPAPSCEQLLKLSDSQKLHMAEINSAASAKTKLLHADLLKAKFFAEAVLKKPEASKTEALQASEAALMKQLEIKSVQKEAKLAVLFDVLSFEQRLLKLKCEASRRNYRPNHPPVPHRPGPVTRPHRPHRPGPVIRPVPGPRYPHPYPAPHRPRCGNYGPSRSPRCL